jgi:hypothetical protein
MCNLYRQRTGPQAIMDMAKAMTSSVGNLARDAKADPDFPDGTQGDCLDYLSQPRFSAGRLGKRW